MDSILWLIQRGVIRSNDVTHRLSEAVRLDYMGSAEFEFGALPASFRRFESNRINCVTRELSNITNEKGTALLMYSFLDTADFVQYRNWLKELRESPMHTVRLKERSEFNLAELEWFKRFNTPTKGKKKYDIPAREQVDFWWDISNDVMFSFNHEFMANIHTFVTNSLTYMNSQKK